ncbi:hypothetical protein RFN57_03550 [Streptomyces violaceochromogenes]|uniref:TrbL/VirB6 plasmid conjugal transfer protein n=1 Tax=Streptomyces violaceochromogenes TaxID=67377 RepID=A0ABU6LPG0_9ACTN|nr:hypothetical protein [Streptomyces violaceochromogenes]MEC7051381.1 hypothetical protein [Streptomyces violaceochromogenes]GHC94184.1 hypothetical protein GCM10010309_79270 [Streptomyces violaceochromogenes]
MPDNDNCRLLSPTARKYCEGDTGGDGGGADGSGAGDGIANSAVTNVKEIADSLIKHIDQLLAPDKAWAPEKADSKVYAEFLWLGQHLTVAIFTCVVVVCALTAWQGAPRLRQMGASTGWSLVAVAGMASTPGAVELLNKAVSASMSAAIGSDKSTIFGVLQKDLEDGADADNPLGIAFVIAALVVGLAFAGLVFLTRQLGMLVFVCMAPLVLASLARGGDTSAVRAWAGRLLGLIFAPFALLLIAPFVRFAEGSLVVDGVLLFAADALMLRMIFHGVPYIGPRVAGAARALVESRTDHPLARAVVRAGVPSYYERENTPRGPRTVDTPGRALTQDGNVLFAAYGLKPRQQPGRLTTLSAVSQVGHDAQRQAQIRQTRADARAAVSPQAPAPRVAGAPAPASASNGPVPSAGPRPGSPNGPGTAPAPRPAPPAGPSSPSNP